jgi:hypothetical protein
MIAKHGARHSATAGLENSHRGDKQTNFFTFYFLIERAKNHILNTKIFSSLT